MEFRSCLHFRARAMITVRVEERTYFSLGSGYK